MREVVASETGVSHAARLKWSRRVAFFTVFWAAYGCGGGVPQPPSYGPSWPIPYTELSPADIHFQTATAFTLSGVHCRLLGVRESDTPATRQRALEFARTWARSVGSYISVANAEKPLNDEDGTPLVWACGADMYTSSLATELVRVGLAEPDYDRWKDYTFDTAAKGVVVPCDWKGSLEWGREGFRRGEKPFVVFRWPPE